MNRQRLLVVLFFLSLFVFVAGVATVAERASVGQWKTTVSYGLTIWGGTVSSLLALVGLSNAVSDFVRRVAVTVLGSLLGSVLTIVCLVVAGSSLLRYGRSHERVYLDCRTYSGHEVKARIHVNDEVDDLECNKAHWLRRTDKVSGEAEGFLPFTSLAVDDLLVAGHIRPPLVQIPPVPKWSCTKGSAIALKPLDDEEGFNKICGVPATGQKWFVAARWELHLTGATGVVARDSKLSVVLANADGRRGVGLESDSISCEPEAIYHAKPPNKARLTILDDCATREKTGESSLRVSLTVCAVEKAIPTFDDGVMVKWQPEKEDPYDVPCLGG